jgi:predicted Zn-dependent protease
MSSLKKMLFCVTFILLLISATFADTARSSALVAEAWKAWGENSQSQVEAKFIAALKEDPSNLRAHMGLYLLYQMQGKEKQAWESLKLILQSKENPYPYAFALDSSPVFNQYLYESDPAALAFLNQLIVKADPEGILKAMANENLGEYYRNRGDLVKSDQHYKNMNAVRDWVLIGPFENVSASGFDKVFPPEVEFAADKSYEAKRGVPARWYRPAAYQPSYWLDFRQHYVDDDAIYYANTFVLSPKKQKVQLRVGTSGSVKVFLNDEQLFEYFDENNNDLDTYIIETELQEGWNRILIKCGLAEIDRCNFMLRVTDGAGDPINGLEFSTDTKNYTRKPNAPVRIVENFAEAFFKAAIRNSPDTFENYALLADVYLHNDKATEAELVLKDALKRLPNCALFHVRMLDAYSRGEKNDEYYTTREHIYSLDKNIPSILDGKISDHLERGEYDKAEELIKEYEQLAPGSARLMEIRLVLFIQKDEVAKRNELVKAALLKYPSNWMFVQSAATQSIESTKRYDRAILLVEKYLTRNYGFSALETLAEYYLSIPNERKWAETYNRIFELEPVSPYYYSKAAKTYFEMKNYLAAEKMIRKAIGLCAGCSDYWSQLGEIQRAKKDSQLANQSYREALKFNPFDYDARRILRELEGKPQIFTLFDSPGVKSDIKELVAKSPDAKAYPEKGAAVLLQDTKRVVYPEGGSELMGEWLIKVFNKQGVDAFKEQVIGFNGYTQTLSVEKAVVFKPNGAEIKADLAGGHAVFKTLEENDTIYLKWNIKNYNSGKLYRDFWDTQYFNGIYPSVLIRYSLLVPRNYQFNSNTLNMPSEPIKREVEAGTIYEWAVKNEPAIEIEANMPGIEDIGKVLYVSSINDWHTIVDWYSDVAKAKTRTTYEIREQVEKLFAGRKEVSNEEKIEKIYNFITENIRYSSVPFRQSGLIPQKARDVLVNKIGDCKDVSTLFISMANEVGVKSYYTLLNTRDAGQNINSVPAILFNHCIVGVETPQGVRYLDLTAQNHPVNTLPMLDTEAFSLLVKPGVKSAGLLSTGNSPFGQTSHHSVMTIKDDLSVQVEHQTEWKGMTSAFPRNYFRFKSATEREKMLSGSLMQVFPGLKMKKQEFEGLDQPGLSAKSTYNFDAPNYVTEAGQFKILKLPWYDRLSIFPPPSEEKRKYPYMFFLYADRLEHRIEIKLPAGYEPVDLGKETKLSSSVADYHLSFSYADGVITARREIVRKKLAVTPEEYAEFKQFFNRVIKEDDRSILLKSKN